MFFTRKKTISYLWILLYWVFNINIISLLSVLSVRSFLSHAGIDVATLNDPIANYWVSSKQFIESLLFSIFIAILFILVDELSEKLKWDRFTFWKVILLKSGVYVLGFIIISFLIFVIIVSLGFFPIDAYDQYHFTISIFFILSIIIVYLVFLVILLNFIMQTTKKVGGTNLINFLTGRYHAPVVEERIFLFLDLKSSTTHAEKLGNLKFSSLIKDCFDEMNFLVDQFDAEIYQYVGDEIVLTWEMDKGLTHLNFIQLFFAFRKALLQRKEYYLSKYGLVPEFKAGANGGLITVAEVGNIRTDIAFHGDVINTASRIQSICNQYDEELLVSAELLKKVPSMNGFITSSLGEIHLRGKQKTVDVIAVKQNVY